MSASYRHRDVIKVLKEEKSQNNRNIQLCDQVTISSKRTMNIEFVQKAIKPFPIYVHKPEMI